MPAPRRLLLLSHLLALGVGGALAWKGHARLQDRALTETAESEAAHSGSADAEAPQPRTRKSETRREGDLATAEDCHAVWLELDRRRLPRAQRIRLQSKIMEKWSKMDLEATLRIAFEDPSWESPYEFMTPVINVVGEKPDEAWAMVEANSFGLDTAQLRWICLSNLIEKAPGKVAGMLGDLPATNRREMVDGLIDQWREPDTQSSLRDEILSRLLALHGTEHGEEILSRAGKKMGGGSNPEEMHGKLVAAKDEASRRLYLSAWAASLRDSGAGYLTALAELPEDERSAVAAQSLRLDSWGGDETFDQIHLAREAGHHDAVEASLTSGAFSTYAQNTSPEEAVRLADWALELPEGTQETELYWRAMQGASVNAFDHVREACDALPPGWQREYGFLGLSYGAIWGSSDREAYHEVLEKITDPVLREVAAQYELDWRSSDASVLPMER
jgi:hypothetical protein